MTAESGGVLGVRSRSLASGRSTIPRMAATTLPQRTRADTTLGRLWANALAYGPGLGATLARFGNRLRRLLLTLAAMVCLVTAAWMVAVPLGLLTAGVAFLWLEWLTTPEPGEERGGP